MPCWTSCHETGICLAIKNDDHESLYSLVPTIHKLLAHYQTLVLPDAPIDEEELDATFRHRQNKINFYYSEESNFMYSEMASAISLFLMYSSAVWERDDSPGPSLREGNRIKAWSLKVGEPKGLRPSLMQA